MDWIENISRRAKTDAKLFNEEGEIVCPRCNGTGTDPDYREVNVILRAIHKLNGWDQNVKLPCCVNCYGMAKIDWIQYANGSCKQELADWREEMRELFLLDVDPFLSYVHQGGIATKIGILDSAIQYFYLDRETDSWIEVIHPQYDIRTLRAGHEWLARFEADDYWGPETNMDIVLLHEDFYIDGPEEHLRTLKAELLRGVDLSMERLVEIKRDLNLFRRDIGNLAEISSDDREITKLSAGFKFTWENVLKKFRLPLSNLPLLTSSKLGPNK